MIDQFFSNPETLQRLHFGPLGAYIDAFAQLLSDQGYARITAQQKIRLVSDLSNWLYEQQLKTEDLDEQRIDAFLQYRHSRGLVNRGARTTLCCLVKQLCASGIIIVAAPEVERNALHNLVKSYAQYLSQERSLTKATIVNYLPTVRSFLSERFGSGPILLAELCSKDISRFILRQAHTVSPGRAQLMVTALRSFLRYLYQRGEITANLAVSVPTVANWRFSELPKFLEANQVERLLQSCDQVSPAGRRDYAILVLLARLGLRAGEVVHMMLDDIDWDTGQLIVRGKGAREDRLPIPQDVGDALAAYLCHGRPHCLSRRVFIRVKAPRQGLTGSAAICDIVRRALARAGLHPDRKGAHLLRHSLARQMLGQGATLSEIGEVLRHQLPNTTEIYIKIDLESLRALSQPWPGGAA